MHQPHIDGERPLTIQNRASVGLETQHLQSTGVNLKLNDSAVKLNFQAVNKAVTNSLFEDMLA